MSQRVMAAVLGIFVLCASLAGIASADEFHYNNLIIGDRAIGMGGAYTGVSDDPSGLYYNPAGVVYTTGRNLSASVNAFYSLDKKYNGVIGGLGWERNATALLPNFFGIVQPFGVFAASAALNALAVMCCWIQPAAFPASSAATPASMRFSVRASSCAAGGQQIPKMQHGLERFDFSIVGLTFAVRVWLPLRACSARFPESSGFHGTGCRSRVSARRPVRQSVGPVPLGAFP